MLEVSNNCHLLLDYTVYLSIISHRFDRRSELGKSHDRLISCGIDNESVQITQFYPSETVWQILRKLLEHGYFFTEMERLA